MKYYLIAGEASGDLHASNLMKEIKKLDFEAKFRFWGGDLMQAQGGQLVKHYKQLAFMGFVEVVQNIGTILGNIKFCKGDISNFHPDCVIFIDYPGFNLRLCKFVKNLGIKTYYYISPQLWAWKSGRVKLIKKYVDHMYVILPFEKDFYAKYNYKVNFVGHPLLDALKHIPKINDQQFRSENRLSNKPIIALLPGSRKQEIKKILPLMLSIKKEFPDYEFVIAGAPSFNLNFYNHLINSNIKIITNQTYQLLQLSEGALVTSGTATLETALLKVPQVVCYKGSKISYFIAKRLIKHIKYISLVNLIMDKEIVKELIQNELTPFNLKKELSKILEAKHRSNLILQYDQLQNKLGESGASKRTAYLIYETLMNNK
ncbi:lipid-A-disaccharide synthase [Apibacter muscae]|uniref:lipid-A-disaccharide synthase n=1 Tax=Apibacter muscae TaxID=2509004 RepID=UPI0011AC05BD|nr:lipid-A-disaccharide synthase [Apibacter muscae]TWP25083.1 lipid-A-disaccharide synthase [Apibacter muscae]